MVISHVANDVEAPAILGLSVASGQLLTVVPRNLATAIGSENIGS